MKIENCTFRVNKSGSSTEVFITNDKGVNTVIHLPPDTEVDASKPLEFVPTPPAKKEATPTA